MKRFLLLILQLLCVQIACALSLNVSSQISTCSANGTVTATATAGAAPYVYVLSGATINAVSPPVNGVYLFNSLPPGNYVVNVTDNNFVTVSTNITVGGSYQEPTLSCSVSGCVITANLVSGGIAPFTYAISSNNGSTFSAPQSNPIFSSLPNGNYVVRVYDSCQNFYPCYAQVNLPSFNFPPYSCSLTAGLDTIQLSTALIGGGSPYLFTCITGNDTVVNNTGIFNSLANCDHLIKIEDACGHSISSNVGSCVTANFALQCLCRNCDVGTITVGASGGMVPYTYSYNTGTSYITNSTGIFTGLPLNQSNYAMEVTDACGRHLYKYIGCLAKPYIAGGNCPWTGTVYVSPHFGCAWCSAPANLYPMTVTCTSVTPNISVIQSTNTGWIPFFNLPVGTHSFTMIDGCGEQESVSISPGSMSLSLFFNDCDSINVKTGLYNTTYTLYDSAGTLFLATDTSGTFGGLQFGSYVVSASNPLCGSQSIMVEIIMPLDQIVTCNTVTATTCSLDSIYFELSYYNPATSMWNIIDSTTNNTGVYNFTGLIPGGAYHLVATHTVTGMSVSNNFNAEQLSLSTSFDCNSLSIIASPYNSENTYTLTDSSGNIIVTDTLPLFMGLTAGNYLLIGTHTGCSAVQIPVTIPPPTPLFCVIPSSKQENGVCIPAWDVSFDYTYYNTFGDFTLVDSAGESYANCLLPNNFPHLLPGTYSISSNCVATTITLPQVFIPDFEITTLALCPDLAEIHIGNYYTDIQWDSIGNTLGYDICGIGYYFQLYYNGNFLNANASSFPYTSFSSLQPGFTYTLYVYPYDPGYFCGSCAIDTIQVTIPYYTRPDLAATYGVICANSPAGSVLATVAGGTPPYTYQIINPFLNNAITTPNNSYLFTGLTTGAYTIQVYDQCGISSDYATTVGPLGFIPQYFRYCNGTLQLQVPNIAGAIYSWTDGNGNLVGSTYNPIVPDMGAQIYTVSVAVNGCANTTNLNVTAQAGGGVMADAGLDVQAYTASTNLNATLMPAGATGTWSQIMPSSGITSFSNVNVPTTNITVSSFPGVYTYVWTVDDGVNSCIDKDTVTIYFINCTLATSLSANIIGTNPNCLGNNGTAYANILGGLGPYAYAWNNNSTSASISGLSPTNYSVTITDLSGCSSPLTKNINLTLPIAVNGYIGSQTNLLCYGDTSGEVLVVATQGTAPFQYALDGGFFGTSNHFNHLSVGNHTITIRDINFCTKTLTFTLTQPSPLNLSITSINASCNGANNGSLTANASGGSGIHVYSWNTGQSTSLINNLGAGNYAVFVTDGNGCNIQASSTITQPSAISIAFLAQTNVSCFGGNNGTATATVTANGGSSPIYTYTWNTSPTQYTSTANSLTAGTYFLTVANTIGCTKTNSITITQPSALSTSIVSQTNVICNGGNNGSAIFSASGGTGTTYTYTWNTTPILYGNVANSLVAGTYTVTVEDSNNCTVTASVIINEPIPFAMNIGTQTNVSCFGGNNGAATINVSNGISPYTYTWNSSPNQYANTANNLAAGNYSVTISDANNCTSSTSVNITEPSSLVANIATQTNVSCFGGNNGLATVAISGGVSPCTYTWNTIPIQYTATATNLSMGNYVVTISDSNDCIATASLNITQPAAISANVSNQMDVSCFGKNDGTATILASGGFPPYTYTWNSSPIQYGNTANNLSAGTYTAVIYDANNCLFSQNISITQPPQIILTNVTQQNTACFGGNGGTILVNVAGGTSPYTYSWNNGQTANIATNLVAGSYTLMVSDAHNCQENYVFEIQQPTALITNMVENAVKCFGNADGSASVNVLAGNAPYVYSWNNGQTTASINNLAAATYIVWITDNTNCVYLDTAKILQPQKLKLLSVVQDTANAICYGESNGIAFATVLGGTSPYLYKWDSGQTTNPAQNLSSGFHSLMIQDTNSCKDSLSFNLIQSPPIRPKIIKIEEAYCNFANGSALLHVSGGNGGFSYSWNTIPSQNTDYLQNVFGDSYVVYITDEKGCKDTLSVSIPNNPLPVAFFMSEPLNNTSIFEHDPIYFQNQSLNAFAYSWDFGDNTFSKLTNPTHIYEYANTYTVTLTSYDMHKECPASFSMTYFILPKGRVFIPTAFSPNGDMINDVFFVSGTGIIEMELIIFDRWGKVITILDSPDKTWNGLDANGKPCPEGVYTFKATLSLNQGYKLENGGTITLFR